MAKPHPFPHRYTVSIENRLLLAPPRSPIAVGAPPQFGGSDRVWSPEELLVAATLECLWTTLEAYARRDHVELHGFSGTGTAVLERGAKVPTFTSIELTVEVTVADSEVDHARRLIDAAEASCIITNALKVPVTVHADVHAVPPAQALG